MEKELILDKKAFLVSKTNSKGVILFANDDFCRIANFKLEELIGKPHNIVKHPDMPKKAFEDLWKTVKSGNIWRGYVKNKIKGGGYYWVFATVYPFKEKDGTINYLSCRRKASELEIKEYEKLYKIFKSKEA